MTAKETTTETTSVTDLDPARLDAFVGRFAADLGAVLHAAIVLISDRVSLYRAMAYSPLNKGRPGCVPGTCHAGQCRLTGRLSRGNVRGTRGL